MRIGLTGATGFVGTRVVQLAGERGHEVIGFSRAADRTIAGCGETRLFQLDQPLHLDGCDALIHLAGETVVGLWTARKRRAILESRRAGTRHVVESIRASRNRPRVLVNASAIGFYGNTGENAVSEESSPGKGFLAEVAKVWEQEAQHAEQFGVRVVRLRISLVLGKHGGALRFMAPIFRVALGGALGSGRQWMSWIHVDDVAGLALFGVENAQATGAINACSPEPCRNLDFTRELAAVLHRPALFRVPAFALKLALGGFSHELLDSKRVVPARALELKYPYRFPQLRGALIGALDCSSCK